MVFGKLKLCFLGTAASIHTLKWASYFAMMGHETHICSYEPVLLGYDLGDIKFHLLKKRVVINTWPFNSIINLPFARKIIKKLIREIKPDILHSHYVTSYGSLGVLSGFHPFVLTAWGSDILLAPQKFLPSKLSVKLYLKKADLITCDAKHMKEAIIRLGADEKKIEVINFGIDTEKFKPSSKNDTLIKKLGLTDEKIIISLRNLDPIYDIKTLIASIPAVVENHPNTKFVIVGQGSQEEELKNLAKDLRILDKTIFIGAVPNGEIPSYLRISDIYVSTSPCDGGIASSTAEAMASGLPVIVTNIGDNKEWVQPDMLFEAGGNEVLSEKIIQLLENEKMRKDIGQQNREKIIKDNDYNNEMARMEKLYYKLINK